MGNYVGELIFDVNTVDIASIRLENIAPIRSKYDDVATSLLDKQDECECTTLGPDGYTDLWDDGGSITINPFKAFAVEHPNRIFAPDTKYSRIYALRYPSFPKLIELNYVVDVSWPGNCKEPYSITDFIQAEPLTDNGSITDVQLTILDWQDDVSSVHLDLSSINGGTVNLEHTEGNTWGGSISNGPGTSPGVYQITATAESHGSTVEAFDYFGGKKRDFMWYF